MTINEELKQALAKYMNSHQDESVAFIAQQFGLTEKEVAEFAIEWAMGLHG